MHAIFTPPLLHSSQRPSQRNPIAYQKATAHAVTASMHYCKGSQLWTNNGQRIYRATEFIFLQSGKSRQLWRGAVGASSWPIRRADAATDSPVPLPFYMRSSNCTTQSKTDRSPRGTPQQTQAKANIWRSCLAVSDREYTRLLTPYIGDRPIPDKWYQANKLIRRLRSPSFSLERRS